MSRRASHRAVAQASGDARSRKARALAEAWPRVRRAKRVVWMLVVLFALQLMMGVGGASDQFDLAKGVAKAGAGAAFVQAALFAWALDTWRRGQGGVLGHGRGTFTSTSHVITLAVILFILAWFVDAILVAGSLDRALGQRSVASGRIDALVQSGGKGCYFFASVSSEQPPADFHLCVKEALWHQLVVGEPVRLDVVDGPLGQIISADRRELEARHHGG